MNTQSVSTPTIISVLVVAVLLFGFLGWRYLTAPPRDARDQDLSRAGVQPRNMSYGPKPPAATGVKPGMVPKKTH